MQRIKRAAVDRDPDMCQACWKRDPRSWRVCGRCGELKPRQGRDRESGAPICERCYRHARPLGACENCGHTKELARTGAKGGPKLCGACAERDLRPKRVCRRCGRLAAIAVRQAADGTRELCFACYAREPRRTCGACGQLAAIHVRGRDGEPDLCRACHRPPTVRCSVCERQRPCSYAATAAPVCWSCKPRRVATCVVCGRERPVKAHSALGGALCGACHVRQRQAARICDRCGELRRPGRQSDGEVLCRECTQLLWPRTCVRCGSADIAFDRRTCPVCALRARLDTLRASGLPSAVEQLDPYLDTLARSPNPQAVLAWFSKPAGLLLGELARGELKISHEALDAAGRRAGSELLRAALVDAGVLAARDELVVALGGWATQRLAAIAAGPDHTALRTFATWKIARELAARREGQRDPAPLAAAMPKRWIAAAIELTAWLHARGLTLSDLDQAALDEWLADGPSGRRAVRRFIAWLERHHTRRGLRVPPDQPGTPTIALDDRERLTALRRLLQDDTIDPQIRVAGCLVALYASRSRASCASPPPICS